MSRWAGTFLALCLLPLVGCERQSAQPTALPQAAPTETVADPPLQRAKRGKKRVALLIPHEDLFWRDFQAFMKAASEQVGLEFECYVAHNNREQMKEQLRMITRGKDRVDAVVFQNFKQSGKDLLRIADEAKVPAFLVNAGVEASACGAPREPLEHWIGSMLPNDEGAGFSLGNLLADEAKRLGLTGSDGKVHMIGLAGIVSDTSSIDRIRGFERAVAKRDDVVLHQVVPTDWSFEDGKLKVEALLKRFPSTTVVWAASDPLALAAVESLKRLGKEPGKKSVVGGVDWTAEALDAVRSGELYTSIGGHFMEGGWVAVLLFDYLEGRDFVSKRASFMSPMLPITQSNVDRYYGAITAAKWGDVDFRGLSALAGDDYAFNAVNVLQQLAEKEKR